MNKYQTASAAWNAAEAIVQQAEAEGRDLSHAEAASFDLAIGRFEQLRAAEGARTGHAGTIAPSDAADARALREAFQAARNGQTTVIDSAISPSVLAERRSLSTSTSTVASSFADRVFVYERNLSPILGLATVIGVSTGSPLTIPRLTTDVNTGGTVTAQAGGITLADPTISSVTLTPMKYATITQVSAELDEDAAFGITDLVAQSAARDLSASYGAHFTTGGGTTVPWGIITRAGIAGTAVGTAVTGGANFLGYKDAVTLFTSVAAPYRQNGTWLASETMFAAMLSWVDTSGRPLLTTGADVPVSLLGRPIVVDVNMAALGSASKSLAFGDVSKYVVARVQPTRLEISRDAYFGSDLIGIKTVVRLDADLVDTQAVKVMISASS